MWRPPEDASEICMRRRGSTRARGASSASSNAPTLRRRFGLNTVSVSLKAMVVINMSRYQDAEIFLFVFKEYFTIIIETILPDQARSARSPKRGGSQ
jgi:hypothetical protein